MRCISYIFEGQCHEGSNFILILNNLLLETENTPYTLFRLNFQLFTDCSFIVGLIFFPGKYSRNNSLKMSTIICYQLVNRRQMSQFMQSVLCFLNNDALEINILASALFSRATGGLSLSIEQSLLVADCLKYSGALNYSV